MKLYLLFCTVVVSAGFWLAISEHAADKRAADRSRQVALDHRIALDRRDAFIASCVADGGEPIVDELDVVCFSKWTRDGMMAVMWRRRKTP